MAVSQKGLLSPWAPGVVAGRGGEEDGSSRSWRPPSSPLHLVHMVFRSMDLKCLVLFKPNINFDPFFHFPG